MRVDLFRRTFQPANIKSKISSSLFDDYFYEGINTDIRTEESINIQFTLFTCVTIASSTSPLNGLNTMALYLTG